MNHTIHNRLGLVAIVSLISFSLWAEAPAGYYDAAIGKSGEALQKSLSAIISNADNVGYDGLWEVYKTTDRRSDGKVWDMYSNATDFTFGTDKCGNYKNEGDCYNREHSVPKSWFSKASPMYSDAWHVYPTDGKINSYRSNNPFGEVGSGASSSKNGFSKWGSCVTPGYTGTVFEPNDEYKGDFARTYFYFATRYQDRINNWGGIFISTYPHIVKWQLDMLLRWNELDPVSQKEIDRNDAVQKEQGNRNPFIDYPELVDLIFGDRRNEPFSPMGEDTPYIETPQGGSTIDMGTTSVNVSDPATMPLQIKGRNITEDVVLTIEGANSDCFAVNPYTLTADAVNNGATVELSYHSSQVGAHSATLRITGGGIASPVVVNLTGEAVDDFVALPARNITYNSFVAAWTPKAGATDYELNVWYDDYSSSAPEKEILNTVFSSKPDTWTYEGYVEYEKNAGAIRLGAGSKDGSATSPALDLSAGDVSITVVASPYNNDNSVLYVSVNGKEIKQITLDGTTTTTIPVKEGTASSKITFMAKKDHRAYLHSVVVKSGGGFTSVALDGYPRRVGNVNEYEVTGLTPTVQYHYTVTPYEGETAQTVSNTVSVSTVASAVDELPADHILIFTSGTTLHILNAPMNAVAQWYTMDGRLCGSRVLHAEESEWELPEGFYIVRVVSRSMQSTVRVRSAQ